VDVLVAARRKSGLSQKAVADLIGKPPSFIAKIELGERRLDLVEYVAIARALDIKPEELMVAIVEALPERLDF
jgi:transcriptional regulator with XRE-family HTH domain